MELCGCHVSFIVTSDTERMLTCEEILTLYERRGHLAYDGEGVTQLEHAWQCGRLAREAGATPQLQLAAWLHDLGHLMTGLSGTPTLDGIDDRHEVLGARALHALFGSSVAAPVALHVAAKRYLVARDPRYLATLSPDSRRSLELQGGAMMPAACERFESMAHAADAKHLREWDDRAKVNGCRPSSLQSALTDLAALMDGLRPRG